MLWYVLTQRYSRDALLGEKLENSAMVPDGAIGLSSA